VTQPSLQSPDEITASVERAVLALLTGTPSYRAASEVGITPEALAAVARAYQQAGRTALTAALRPSETWDQVVVEFTDWNAAEHTAATVLVPLLQDPEVTSSWWFLRKHPYWRIRYQPSADATAGLARRQVSRCLDDLTAAGLLRGWRNGSYDPEVLAFGGPAGISIAHQLFCADSVGVLATFGQAALVGNASRPVGRKELSILLCAALMRSTHLDWFEQGDTWHRIALLRPRPQGIATAHRDPIRTLLTADTTPTSPLLGSGGPAATITPWATAFRRAGQSLATAANNSQLQRGLRDILAHLIIFHWNRLGLTLTTQATLARAAQDVIMNTGSR
jgi:thiopeptide-type bacteriocin biosynthesis protein